MAARRSTRKKHRAKKRPKIAAVGSNGLELVVWGIGDTRDEAEEDATPYVEDSTIAPRLTYVEIDEAQRAQIVAGNVSCASLGIEVQNYRGRPEYELRKKD